MNTKLTLGLTLAGLTSAQAGIIYSSGTLNAAVPDNNPNGYASSIAVSGLGSPLTSVSVQLNLSGGYNGDLYAYLTFDGNLVTLLNRVGSGGGNTFGYGDAGLNVTLVDGAANGNIHNYQNVAGYASLISSGAAFTPDSGGITFAGAYNGLNPNGTWSLFLADLSAGDQSTLSSWSLDITAVPEPVNTALLVTGVLAAAVGLGRWWLQGRALALTKSAPISHELSA